MSDLKIIKSFGYLSCVICRQYIITTFIFQKSCIRFGAMSNVIAQNQ